MVGQGVPAGTVHEGGLSGTEVPRGEAADGRACSRDVVSRSLPESLALWGLGLGDMVTRWPGAKRDDHYMVTTWVLGLVRDGHFLAL